MKIRLTQKGLLFVLIPLIIQLGFLAALAYLNAQAEHELELAFHSGQISDSTNKLVHHMFEMVSLSPGEFAKTLYAEGNENAIAKIKNDLEELKEIVKGNSKQEAIIQSSIDSSAEAHQILKQLRLDIDADSPFAMATNLDVLRTKLRSCLKRMLSKELVNMGQAEQEKVKISHKKQIREAERIKLLLAAGVIFNILLTVILTLVFSKQIVARLKIILDNSFKLASGLPLSPPQAGSDEIAHVDLSFHEMASALAAAKQKEKSLVEHSLDLICSTDPTGRITSINPACEMITGYSEEELRGLNLRHILAGADIDVLKKSLSHQTEGLTESKFESPIAHKDGKLVHVSWSMRWVPTEGEFFCVGHDITARKETEQLKQEFMGMISHDLRTPLATLSNYLEMLETGLFGELSERGTHQLKVAERNANRMASLINDLLDIERAESGRLQLERSMTRLDELLDQSVKSVSSLASREGVALELTNTNVKAFVDPKRLSQVLVNLLSNAIKFSPKNSLVKVNAEQKDGMVVISVTDQGRGVPNDMKEAIFERFQQVKIADAVDKGGSGLGLAICKNIVELHGGKILVTDNKPEGSVFSFSIPITDAASQ